MKELIWASNFIDELSDSILNTYHHYKKQYQITQKSKHDYVTDVDIQLESFIINSIQSKFPDHQAFGEETFPSYVDLEKPTWVIDPLDGTSNFIHQLPFFGCSIALIYQKKVIMGLVIDFIHNDIFKAYLHEGAYLNNQKISCKNNKSDFIGISTGLIEKAATLQPKVLSLLRQHGKFRILGAQALHLCYVAASRLKSCVNYEAKFWDDAAGSLILHEADGKYISQTGYSPSNVNSQNISGNLFSCALSEIATESNENLQEIISLLQ